MAEKVQLSKETFVPFIKRAGVILVNMLTEAKKKHKDTYRWHNVYERTITELGSPDKVPDKYFDEYMLINEKKSELPAAIRNAVKDICGNALSIYFDEQKKKKGS